MRGGGYIGRSFTVHRDDIKRFHALPWYRKMRGLEKWLRREYGEVIYPGGSYKRNVPIE